MAPISVYLIVLAGCVGLLLTGFDWHVMFKKSESRGWRRNLQMLFIFSITIWAFTYPRC